MIIVGVEKRVGRRIHFGLCLRLLLRVPKASTYVIVLEAFLVQRIPMASW
jgi:hypothetical protein